MAIVMTYRSDRNKLIPRPVLVVLIALYKPTHSKEIREKFSIQRQKPIANGKSNISLPRLSGSDWRCAQILIA
jgi:hypothetical protein